MQEFARAKNKELGELKVKLEHSEKASESTIHKIGYLEVSVSRFARSVTI